MDPMTKRLRDAVRHIPYAWVRVYRDETMWAGYDDSFRRRRLSRRNPSFDAEQSPVALDKKSGTEEVKAALEAAGFRCEMQGISGTSGERIIDVFV